MPEKSHRVDLLSKGLILMQGRCVLNTSRCQDILRLVNECAILYISVTMIAVRITPYQ